MPTDSANEAHGTPFARKFQDAVTLIEYDGQPVVVARELGAFLDYAQAGQKLVDRLTTEWSDEFIDGVDIIVLRNGRLAAFKKICTELGLKLVDKRAPSLLLLTTSGIQLVLARTEKPQGKIFRRWLVSEVIPAYQASKTLPGPAPIVALPAVGERRGPPQGGAAGEPVSRGRPQFNPRLLAGGEAEEPSLRFLVETDWREFGVYALDHGKAPTRPLNLHDHLLGRARTAVRGITGPRRRVLIEETAVELGLLFGITLPTFANAEPTDGDRRALGRALFVIEALTDVQLVRVLALLGARQEQARYRDWCEFPPAGWPTVDRTWGSA
jgi:prophage antirepressor-like protein